MTKPVTTKIIKIVFTGEDGVLYVISQLHVFYKGRLIFRYLMQDTLGKVINQTQ